MQYSGRCVTVFILSSNHMVTPRDTVSRIPPNGRLPRPESK